MLFHNETVIFLTGIVLGAVTLLSWGLALSGAPAVWRKRWAVANTLLTAGLFFFLGQRTLSPWFSVVVANALILGGYLTLEGGVRAFAGKPFSRWILGLSAVTYLVTFPLFTFVWDSYAVRAALHACFAFSIMVRLCGLVLFDLPDEKKEHPLLVRGIAGLFAALALFYLVRGVAVFFDKAKTNLDPSGTLSSLFIFAMIALLSWTFGLMLLDTLRNQRLLQESLAARDWMFELISHDLRGPIGTLASLLEFLRNKETSPQEYDEIVDLTLHSAQSSYLLLEKLLEWAGSQRGELQLHPGPVSAATLVEAAVHPLTASVEAKGLLLETDIEPNLVLRGDAASLEVVVRNLASNAVKFTPTGGVVRIQGRRAGRLAQLSLWNSGATISPSVLRTIQEGHPLQSTPGTNGEKGTGLGLSLCRNFVRANHGTMQFSSGDEGTRVVLSFPLA